MSRMDLLLPKVAVVVVVVVVGIMLLHCDYCQAYLTPNGGVVQQQQQQHKNALDGSLAQGIRERMSSPSFLEAIPRKKKHCLCPDDEDQDQEEEEETLEDRREALFAMMGSLWALSGSPLSPLPPAAHAVYGSDAKIEMPNPIQGMSDRANKQCLVESLGNRECLVYQEDSEKFLYKGADVKVLLERIQTASKALETQIPPLVETKQWSKLNGVLTGPMGQLSVTLTTLSQLTENPKDAKQKAQDVKNDVFAMGTATTNKQGEQVLKYQQKALQDLAIFLTSM